MITLYQLPSVWGLPSYSPFCIKVETYLRMADLEFRTALGDSRKGPTKKIPYIDDDGQLIGDSGIILEHLAKKQGGDLDAHLTPQQRASAHQARRTLEESFYWVIIYSQWAEDDGWENVKKVFEPLIPGAVRWIAYPMVRKNIFKAMHGHGIGRHQRERVYRIGCDDLDSIATSLGNGPYFFGDRPSSVDATVFAFLAAALASPNDNPLRTHARSLSNVTEYVERIRQRYYAPAS